MSALTLLLCLFCQVLVVAGNLLLKHAMAGMDGQERSRLQTGSWLFAGAGLVVALLCLATIRVVRQGRNPWWTRAPLDRREARRRRA